MTLHLDITRWSAPKWDWLYSLQPKMEKLHTISKKKDQKMTVAQIMNSWLQNSDFIYLFIYFFNSDFKLKKVGKTTRSFRYDLNQIPYDSTVEVTNRFKGLDMIECLKNYGQGFMTWYRRLLSRPPSPRRKKCKRQNGWGCLTNSWEEKRSKKQMRKGKIYPSQCRVPKNRKERLKKA